MTPEEIDAQVELWMGTPEGAELWKLMWIWPKTCDNHIPGWKWSAAMKKQYIRVMRWHLNMTVPEDDDVQPESCTVLE